MKRQNLIISQIVINKQYMSHPHVQGQFCEGLCNVSVSLVPRIAFQKPFIVVCSISIKLKWIRKVDIFQKYKFKI